MAKLEAGEFAVSKQGETMHVIGKVARLNWHCADRGGTLKTWGYPSFLAYRTKCVSTLEASAQADASFSPA